VNVQSILAAGGVGALVYIIVMVAWKPLLTIIGRAAHLNDQEYNSAVVASAVVTGIGLAIANSIGSPTWPTTGAAWILLAVQGATYGLSAVGWSQATANLARQAPTPPTTTSGTMPVILTSTHDPKVVP
jgi:hypothetical protein